MRTFLRRLWASLLMMRADAILLRHWERQDSVARAHISCLNAQIDMARLSAMPPFRYSVDVLPSKMRLKCEGTTGRCDVRCGKADASCVMLGEHPTCHYDCSIAL